MNEIRPVVRACVTGLLVPLIGFSGGCVAIPTKANVAQSGEVQAADGALTATVLYSRDFSPETPRSLGEEVVECVTRGLTETAPEIRIVSEEEFDRAIFGVKSGEVLLRRDTIGPLLTRPDVSQRVGQSGLTHLILVEGATHNVPGNSGSWVVPYSMGAWGESKRNTQFTATIFELMSAKEVQVKASAEGNQVFVFAFPVPIVGWADATESASCAALGAGVARALRGKVRDEGR